MNAPTTNRLAAPILLIEDEPSVSAFVRAALERRGYRVVQVSDGAAALRELSNNTYMGVISDIRMPGEINGADVHKWIQRHKPELGERIILISGDTANSDTQLLLSDSETPCIEKPFRVQQLISTVEITFGKP
jgi:DNA-binding response OmpR family regulator